MKFGMTSLTLRNHPVADVVRYAKEAGLEGIEWGVSDGHMPLCNPERAREIRKLSEENGIDIFSLGAYCNMEDKEACDQVVETAVLLGAPIIRIWAGRKSPADCDDAYRKLIVDNTVAMAKKAAEHNIVLGFEYHPATLTETCDEALWLVKTVNQENVGLYWQPPYTLTPEENMRDRARVLPYCVGNIHIQNYTQQTGYQLLSDMQDTLKLYFGDLKQEDYRVMIEFVKDGAVENLMADAAALRKI